MAFKKTMIQRLFSIARCPNPAPSLKPPLRLDPAKMSTDPDPGEASGIIWRAIQRRPLHQASSMLPGIRSIPTGHDQLIEKLRGFDTARDRIRFEGLIPPPMTAATTPADPDKITLTARDVNKLLRASHLERMKAHLKGIQKGWVSYSEFVEICRQGCSGDEERAVVMAKLLDDSGAVIVLGNAVCLHPDQVVKAIQGLLPLPLSPNDKRPKELEAMEKQKEEIEQEVDALVLRELWMGLGYLVAHLMGAFVGRHGAHLLLRNLRLFHGWPCVFPPNLQGTRPPSRAPIKADSRLSARSSSPAVDSMSRGIMS